MKRSRFTDQQIAFVLKQAEQGTQVAEVTRKMGISEQTFYRWKKKFGGLMSTAGSVAADAGRGLALRMAHGTPYLSDHFQNQFEYWGISTSFAFIEQPQTNGVAERFIRTLKE